MIETPTGTPLRSRFPHDTHVPHHARRHALPLELAASCDGPREPVLDIGASPFTTLLHETLGRPVDTLGFTAPKAPAGGEHTTFDLTHATRPAAWPRIGPYGLVVFAE